MCSSDLYEGVYPLVSAISRPLISKHLVRAAHQFGADTISHGCTGKGNDQVRFEVSIASIDPTLKAISPIRDLSLTRDVEIAFAKEHKLPITQTEKSPYSIDQNVWGRAIETGFLEDPWNGPTKDCYSYTDDPAFPPVEDEVVKKRAHYVEVKEKSLNDIKQGAKYVTSNEDKLKLYEQLANGYKAYEYDSAMTYVKKRPCSCPKEQQHLIS